MEPDKEDQGPQKVGCLTTVLLWIFIGLPLLIVNGMSECLPRDAPTTAACDADKQADVLFWLIGFPLLCAFAGWLVYRTGKHMRK